MVLRRGASVISCTLMWIFVERNCGEISTIWVWARFRSGRSMHFGRGKLSSGVNLFFTGGPCFVTMLVWLRLQIIVIVTLKKGILKVIGILREDYLERYLQESILLAVPTKRYYWSPSSSRNIYCTYGCKRRNKYFTRKWRITKF